jgi:uncharacterized protein YkwD
MPTLFAPRRFALLVALSLALTSFGGMAAPSGVRATWDVGRADAASEDFLANLTNESRARTGLSALPTDEELAALARWRSRDMAERGYFSHAIPPGGTKVFDELSARGYCYEVAGENIGWLSGPDAGAEQRIQEMFLNSETHRDVLMGEAWDVIGVGSWKRADGRHYWTVLFADRCEVKSSQAATATAVPALLVSLVLGFARLLPEG